MGEPSHEFAFPIWHALIDLDELPGLPRELRFFSHNRFNVFSFHDGDHMGPASEPVRVKLERWLNSRGVTRAPAQILLLTHLRLIGSVFNPVSFFFCRDRDGTLQHVVAEVNNTFGETYCYLLEGDGRLVEAERDKRFHVSPFQPVDGQYRFRITPPGPRISVHIELLREGNRVFDATLTEARRALSTTALVKTALRYPHMGLWTLALIHYQAIRLWIKKAPFHTKPELPVEAWRTRHE
jgi:DUF1365 family protein